MCAHTSQFILRSRGSDPAEAHMHPQFTSILALQRVQELRADADRTRRTATPGASGRVTRSRIAVAAAVRGYFGYALETDEQPLRGTGRRVGRAGARRPGGHRRTVH